jgi:phosphatidylserine/phosphatidylglycerophosphate/cardiolipin synthase-like enzyme
VEVDCVKVFVEPGEGVTPLIKAIQRAKKSVDILIFRFDRADIEKALLSAASRGVAVRALIAYTNRGGEKHLRELEMRLLAEGVTVARTADDLARYHGKMMIVDRAELYLLAFNFISLDIEHSRSFGAVTRDPVLVREAVKLFEADSHRQTYSAGSANFIVSPVNARRELEAFIRKAKKELLIYDPHVSDPAMIHLLEERAEAGVSIRIIGRLIRKSPGLSVHKLPSMRLHTRAICRDSQWLFLGSQSLRTSELDARREVGATFKSPQAVKLIASVFEKDWSDAEKAKAEGAAETPPAAKVAKKVAKAVSKTLPPVGPTLQIAVREVVGREIAIPLDGEELEGTVKEAVVQAVKDVVRDAVQEIVEENDSVATR